MDLNKLNRLYFKYLRAAEKWEVANRSSGISMSLINNPFLAFAAEIRESIGLAIMFKNSWED